jgi:hypothetical protein
MNDLRNEKTAPGTVAGSVRILLRAEGLCILAAATVAYAKLGNGWTIFFSCFFMPDVSFAGYLAGPRIGAAFYNAAHSYAGAAFCLVLAIALTSQFFLVAGLIWSGHIGFDRAFGYGLKYGQGFNLTHLGVIGRRKKDELRS